ncbi:M56 family metallopeptidase [Ascidiimonas aurantiaca]|uniref:M56 family metallopeptidase n=1 Tax=Ascidiimonas aurantiaca TaxID=1685432 RepID=UPI0030EED59E
MEPEVIVMTFLNSLWIGGVMFLAVYLLMALMPRNNAALRYNVLVGGMLAFVIAIGYVFVEAFLGTNTKSYMISLPEWSHITEIYLAGQPEHNLETGKAYIGFINQFFSLLMNHSQTIMLLWVGIVLYKGTIMALGLKKMQGLKTKNILPAGVYWENRIKELAIVLRIKENVSIVQSAMVKAPVVFGYFKPVILVPLGLLTQMPAEQVESVILHELAHIKRKDYLINILQSILEIVFFFNPAVLWISGLIRTERENCCDDLVVKKIENRVDYIKALISCVEANQAKPSYAMRLSGNDGHLLKRVNRMLNKKERKHNSFEKGILSILLAIVMLTSLAFTKSTPVASKNDLASTPTNVQDKQENGFEEEPERTYLLTGLTAEYLDEQQSEDIESILSSMILDMKNEGLLVSENALSFMLNKEQFIINGEKIASHIQVRYEAKYLKRSDWTLCYNYLLKH